MQAISFAQPGHFFLDVVSGYLIITNQQSPDSEEFVVRDCKETFFMTPHKEKSSWLCKANKHYSAYHESSA